MQNDWPIAVAFVVVGILIGCCVDVGLYAAYGPNRSVEVLVTTAR
jgi:hypothetical protein